MRIMSRADKLTNQTAWFWLGDGEVDLLREQTKLEHVLRCQEKFEIVITRLV